MSQLAFQEFCYYCHDTERKPSWTYLGGAVGEIHYICHRKKCLQAHAAYLLKYRMSKEDKLKRRS